MAVKYFCDKCGKELSNHEVCVARIEMPPNELLGKLQGRSNKRDLCIDCVLEFLDSTDPEDICPKS